MKNLQAQEISMVSGGNLRERVESAIVNNSFVSSLVCGGLIGALASASMADANKVPPTAFNILAGGVFGALIGGLGHDFGCIKSHSEKANLIIV